MGVGLSQVRHLRVRKLEVPDSRVIFIWTAGTLLRDSSIPSITLKIPFARASISLRRDIQKNRSTAKSDLDSGELVSHTQGCHSRPKK